VSALNGQLPSLTKAEFKWLCESWCRVPSRRDFEAAHAESKTPGDTPGVLDSYRSLTDVLIEGFLNLLLGNVAYDLLLNLTTFDNE
jgi:hypothetical protein